MTNFTENVDAFADGNAEQTARLAAAYGEIMTDISKGVEKAGYLVEKSGGSVRGVPELRQLLQIMDGGFAKIAREVIADAQALAPAGEADPAASEDPPAA